MPLQSAIAYKDTDYAACPNVQSAPASKYPYKWTLIGLGIFCAGFWFVAAAVVSALS